MDTVICPTTINYWHH